MAHKPSNKNFYIFLVLILEQVGFSSQKRHTTATPPLPLLPLPDYSQLKWQQREIIMFFHFGVNTFTDSEWGTGAEDPSIFNPTGLNTGQWIDTAIQAGVSLVILTAKHHDGFCLWPSRYTDHSVVSSNWKNGKGDVVHELVDSAKARGVDVGLYLSPWDRHERRYGKEKAYNEYYMAQLQELLHKKHNFRDYLRRGTRPRSWWPWLMDGLQYGSVREIWFDGAKGANATNMTYYFNDWFAMVKELQSSINIFSDAGPNIRWVGDENGFAGNTCWSTINRTSLSIGNASLENYLNTGDPKGTDWLPAECDVSIRKGWFWHKSQSPKKLIELLDIYYNSVGRNCVLLLNVPPNTTGLISDVDVQQLKQFRYAIEAIFLGDVAGMCSVQASSQRGGNGSEFGPEKVLDYDHLWTYWTPNEDVREKHWIELTAKNGNVKFNVIRIQEAIGLGQRIKNYEIYIDGKLVIKGTTIGYKRLHRLEKGVVDASSVRVKITGSRAIPLISSIGLHFDPFWNPVGKSASEVRP